MALQNQRIYTNRSNSTAMYLDWSEEWISNGNDNYSNISWRVGFHNSSGGTVYWYSNALKILSSNLGGNGLTTGTWSNITIGPGASVQVGNGGFNYGHDSAGNAIISGSIQGWWYGGGNSSTASGSWWLTNIPRYAVISSVTGNLTDESSSVVINFSNPPGGACTAKLYVRYQGSGGGYTQVLNKTSYSSGANLAGDIDWNSLRTVLTGHNFGEILYRITNSVGDTTTGAFTVEVINDAPTFTTYTYKDNNTTMAAMTGNDQVIVQNPGGLTNPTSDLLVTVTSGNKAVALKNATMVDYLVTLGAYSDPVAYSGVSNVTKAVGGVNLSGAQTLQVRARDSRSNYTQVDTGITVIPYAMPVVNATLTRSNNFDAAVRLTFTSISISSITVGGIDKNGIKSTATGTANRVEYRYKTNAGSYGSWTDRTASVAAGSGGSAAVTVAYIDLVAAPTASNTYEAQVRVTDNLGNATTITIYLGSGQPIFRIGTDTNIYNNEVQVMPAIDEDDFASNSATRVPTQQSVKAYVAPVYAAGYVGGQLTADTVISLTHNSGSGITFNGSNTYTVVTAGVYFIHFQQLVQSSNADNLYIRINGSLVGRAWQNAIQKDMSTSFMGPLSAGATIQLYRGDAVEYVWGDTHSAYQIFKL